MDSGDGMGTECILKTGHRVHAEECQKKKERNKERSKVKSYGPVLNKGLLSTIATLSPPHPFIEMSAIVSKKTLLRSQLRKVLKSISKQDIAEQSQEISKQLQSVITKYHGSVSAFSSIRKIGCFLSMDQGEVDTKYILEWLFHPQTHSNLTKIEVFLPRCTSTEETGQVKLRYHPESDTLIEHPHLTFHSVDSLDTIRKWKPQGKYQLREPPRETPDPLPPQMDIMIVPGVAFNIKNGARMGWGAGYYDDFIRRYSLRYNTKPLLIGVCLKQQIVPEVELEPHDQIMDCIIAGDGNVHWINKDFMQ